MFTRKVTKMDEVKKTESKPIAEPRVTAPRATSKAGTIALKGNRGQIFDSAEKLERAGLVIQEGQAPAEGETAKREDAKKPVTVKVYEGFKCPACDNSTDFSLVSHGVRCDSCRNTLLISSSVKNHWQRKG